jgi:signal peptidase I
MSHPMARPLATHEPPAPLRPGGATRRSLAIAAGVSVAAVALTQGYSVAVRALTVNESYVGFLAVQGVLLGLLLLAVRLEGRPLRDFGFTLRGSLTQTLAFSALLVMMYLALSIDPGFIFGFGKIPPPTGWLFGFFLLSAPVVAVAEVGLFFGYLFRTLSRAVSLRTATLLSAGAFSLYSTNFTIFSLLGPTTAVEYVFSTSVVDFVLGIVLALYCYKSQWSLLGPITLLSGVLAAASLLPVGVAFPSWEVSFASALIAETVLLIVVGLGLREPRLQSLRYLGERIGPRRFRFRNRVRDRQGARSLLITGAVVGVVAISIGYGLPSVLGTSQPLLAIASDSMVPTLDRGTLVVIEHVAPSAITVGTIIAVSVSCLPSPTVHRVIKIVSFGPNWVYQTKGDANPTQDPCTVPYNDVHGAVILNVPYLGFLILDPLFAGAVVVLLLVIPVAWREERR